MGNYKAQDSSPAQYILITSGRGPVECCWVVAQLAIKMTAALKKYGLNPVQVQGEKGPQNRTFYSVLIRIEGAVSVEFRKKWEGTVKWIGKSPFRKYHKRKNWFVGLKWLEMEEKLSWKESDLEFQTFKASGPGGQHRNKVESAVRLIHKPSGLSIAVSESRSQQQNKKLARKRFLAIYQRWVLQEQQKIIMNQWNQHFLLERGNAIKIFKGREFAPSKI